MFTEDTPEVVDAALDDLQRTAGVLLLQPRLAGNSGVGEVDGVETDTAVTGGFPQRNLILRENRDETWQSDL